MLTLDSIYVCNLLDSHSELPYLQNEALYVHGDNKSFTKQQYCMLPFTDGNNNNDDQLEVVLIPEPQPINITKRKT